MADVRHVKAQASTVSIMSLRISQRHAEAGGGRLKRGVVFPILRAAMPRVPLARRDAPWHVRTGAIPLPFPYGGDLLPLPPYPHCSIPCITLPTPPKEKPRPENAAANHPRQCYCTSHRTAFSVLTKTMLPCPCGRLACRGSVKSRYALSKSAPALWSGAT